jgi:hypothetical protein
MLKIRPPIKDYGTINFEGKPTSFIYLGDSRIKKKKHWKLLGESYNYLSLKLKDGNYLRLRSKIEGKKVGQLRNI